MKPMTACPPDVEKVFASYPAAVRKDLLFLRELILNTASETDGVEDLEETLKWYEPSYLTRDGSTIRIAWKKSKPGEYGMYFNCNSKLVDTFRELYPSEFSFEGNRAIIFQQGATVPVRAVKHCISLSLTYHKIKHLPLLGQ